MKKIIITLSLALISTGLMAEQKPVDFPGLASSSFENLYNKSRANDLREENLFRGEIFGSINSLNEVSGGDHNYSSGMGGHKESAIKGPGTDGKVSMSMGPAGDR